MGQVRKRADAAAETSLQRPDDSAIYFSVVVKDAGRILLPADVRSALGVGEGDTLQGVVKDGELTLLTSRTALRKTRERLARLVPRSVSLVDELIAERRAEVAREEEEAKKARR